MNFLFKFNEISIYLIILSMLILSTSFIKFKKFLDIVVIIFSAISHSFILSQRNISYDSVVYYDYYANEIFQFEALFTAIGRTLKYFDISPDVYLIFLDFFQLIVFGFGLYFLINNRRLFFVILAIWLSSMWSISYGANVIRQGMSSIIIFLSYIYYINNNSKFTSLLLLISGLIISANIHWTSLLMGVIFLLAFFLEGLKIKFCIIFIIIFTLIGGLFTIPYDYIYFSNEILSNERSPAYIRLLLAFALFLIYSFFINSIDYVPKILYANYNVIKVFLLTLSLLSSMPELFSRINAYSWPYEVFIVGSIIYYKILNNKLYTVGYSFFASLSLIVIFGIVGTMNIVSYRILGLE